MLRLRTSATFNNSGGAKDYEKLSNKPKINNVELVGNKSSQDLGLQPAGSYLTQETDPVFGSSAAATILSQDISSWNAKYTKPDTGIPSTDIASGVIPDVSNFITKTVDDLTNYYKKSETYTQAEVNSLIGAISSMNILVVQTLPIQDISTTTIYLVPKSTSQTNNVYDEYIYVNNAWEKIGDTEIDLSNYIQKSQTAGLVKNDGTIDTNQYENQTNKTTNISDQSTDTQYPSAKSVYDYHFNNSGNYILNMNDYNTDAKALDFKTLKKDVTYFGTWGGQYSLSLHVKFYYNETTYYLNKGIGPNLIFPYIYIVRTKDIPETLSTTTTVGYLIYCEAYKFYKYAIKITTSDVQLQDLSYDSPLSIINLNQTVSGKKTFSVLPESSVAPTNDNQLVNKKYVDDNIGNIETILGEITTGGGVS